MRRYSPEKAYFKIIDDLYDRLSPRRVISIRSGGSVPLGTYVGETDIDIFIETNNIYGTMRNLRLYYGDGMRKDGELDIWYVPKIYGYAVDFVVISPDTDKIQTLEHVSYYMDIMDEDMRKRTVELKKFFKDINCYGAEVGGVTGIWCTRMAELYPNVDVALKSMVLKLVNDGRLFTEDPTLEGRNLFACVTDFKKLNIINRINHYLTTGEEPIVNLDYYIKMYKYIYKIYRRPSLGTDREFQTVYSSVKRTWNEIKHKIKWWNPYMEYDTLFDKKYIYLGINLVPTKIEGSAYEFIDADVLDEETIDILLYNGGILVYDDNDENELRYIKYKRDPPFTDVIKEFEKGLYNRLEDVYISMEKM